jgi:hypothetical protein
MGTNSSRNSSRNDDEPNDRQRLAADELDSVADVEPPDNYLDEFPRWNSAVDVVIPREVARAVAHRVGTVSARGKTVIDRTVTDFASDHAQVTERFLVPTGSGAVPLAEWVEQRGVPVERTEGGRDSAETATTTVVDDGHTRAHFPARAEYRPGADIQLVITLDVPGHVLDVSGGFEELTDSVRLRPATDE